MRKKWAKTSAKMALLTAGFVVIGSGAGYAGEVTHGDFGVGSGNQLHVPASAPINASGNAGSVLGQARALSESGAAVHNDGSNNQLSSGRFGVLGGNQGDVPISAPINATGNAGTIGGQAWAASKSAAGVVNGHRDRDRGRDASAPSSSMHQVTRPVTDTTRKAVPQAAQSPLSGATSSLPSPLSSITDVAKSIPGGGVPSTGALGKLPSVSGLGKSQPSAGGQGKSLPAAGGLGKSLPLRKKQHMAASSSSSHHGGTQLSSGDFGVLSGNQAHAPVSAPVNACGNAGSVLGQAAAACKGGAAVHNSGGNQLSSGKFGVLGGNQLNAPISAPVNLCGNSVSVVGQALSKCKGGAAVANGHTHRVWSPKQSAPQAPAPQQGPAQPAPQEPQQKPAKPAPKPQLPKAHLPKLPVNVHKTAPAACDCGPVPMAKTPKVPSVGLPKPHVSLPKAEKPAVELPKPQLPKAHLPKPQLPKADVGLPQQTSDCGCAPEKAPKAEAPKAKAAAPASHLAKKHQTVGTPADETSRSVSSILEGQNSPVSLTDSVTK